MLADLGFIYYYKRKGQHFKFFSKKILVFSWIFFVVLLILFVYTIYTLRKQYLLNVFETIYFYSFNLIIMLLFVWAASPQKDKKANEQEPM